MLNKIGACYTNNLTTDDDFSFLLLGVSRLSDHQTGLQLVRKNKLAYKTFIQQLIGLIMLIEFHACVGGIRTRSRCC